MAFDSTTRNRLAHFVADARGLIAEEFTQQFQSLYGISPKGDCTPLEKLPHLDEMQLATAALLRERIQYLIKSHPDDKGGAQAAVERLAREQAFTVLNRFAAIRMAEKRGIIVESIGKSYQSKGFKVYETVTGSGLGEAYHRYQRYLFCLFDELAVDLGVLFDRRSPHALLFPREQALLAMLELINDPEIEPLWAEDETIGWIYQYYNDPLERKKMREQSAAPRNSRELAVRNQFFTPRYVVEFLTDNTLGRIWYEMTKGRTKLKEQCRYLVRRPTEVFLGPEEGAPEVSSKEASENLSQEELLRQTVFVPHRPLKDPRSILMLDPACGSMHFGLYAFDLFEVIYEEFWDLTTETTENTESAEHSFSSSSPSSVSSVHSVVNTPLRSLYTTKEEFLRDVPRLIIENNLHGIDIDPRCAQIAGLSLWLRAQKAWQRLGLSPAQRPAIKRSNIVCAEPMPGEKELLREFVEREFPVAERAVCLRLLEAIFDKMQLAGEAGSLLKIEEEIRSAIEDAKKQWKAGPQMEQSQLFSGEKLKQQDIPLDYSGLTESEFWDQLEEKIYAALRDYAEQAENGGGFQRRLFAEDAARGFAFIDVCRKRYDVALMNPPFGDWSLGFKHLAKESYPYSYCDILASFIERGGLLLKQAGKLGAITSRTCFFLSSFEMWRERIILSLLKPQLIADLGLGVMDAAMVESAAYVLSSPLEGRGEAPMSCFRLLNNTEPANRLLDMIQAGSAGSAAKNYFEVSPSSFSIVPGAPFSYWVTDSLRNVFRLLPSFEPASGVVRVGTQTSCDERFVRTWWEVEQIKITRDRKSEQKDAKWVAFSKGGGMSRYYCEFPLVVNWSADGMEIKEFNQNTGSNKGGHWSRNIRSPEYYFASGLTWAMRASALGVCAMPAGCIFSTNAYGCFPKFDPLVTLAVLASRPAAFLIDMMLEREGFSKFVPGVVQRLPFPEQIDVAIQGALRVSTLAAWQTVRNEFSATETSCCFVQFSGLTRLYSIQLACSESKSQIDSMAETYRVCRQQIDEMAFSIYSCTEHDQTTINERFGASGSIELEALDIVEESDETLPVEISSFTRALCQNLLGIAFGRWDIRYATGEQAAPELPDPFAPMPVCPPGQLQNAQGLPLGKEEVGRMKEEGIWNYPIEIPWDGILVDDPNHPLDIERRVREVIEIIWSGQEGGPTAEAIEHEACEILGVKSLRGYFRKPAGFFADHLKRYSKSRRQAPIYWPLSTASGSYTLWIYYHRLTDQTLHTVLADFLEPKIRNVQAELDAHQAGGNGQKAGESRDFLDELKDLRDEIERIIKLPWKPNLNDGVLITASPLWKLFRLTKWQKDLKACWDDLEAGEYDWAHLAHSIWPQRVENACERDRSIAIAHGLEHLCKVEPPKPKKKRAKTKNSAEQLEIIEQ